MHLVFLNQYYPPDVAPTGVMLEAVTGLLSRDGHEVTVICAEGGYATPSATRHSEAIRGEKQFKNEEADAEEDGEVDLGRRKVRVIRIRATRLGRGSLLGKLADYASYYIGVKWRLLTMRQRPDRIVALTTPPFLSIIARAISKLRGADHAHWVMDLYPDVMVAHGMLKEGGILHRMLALFARWGFGGSRCAALVTLGPDMADRLGVHADAAKKVDWVPLWGSGSRHPVDASGEDVAMAALQLRRGRGWGDDELVVMYSGNMGRGHRFGEIFEAARLLARRDLREKPKPSAERPAEAGSGCEPTTCSTNMASTRLVFYGGGKREKDVAEFAAKHPECGFELHDYSPSGQLTEHLLSADIHLVSLDGNWTGTMVPSKLQGIFGVGRPAIFIGSRHSSIGRWILESGGGWVVEPGDVQGLVAAIEEGREPGVRRERGEAAAAYAAQYFSKAINASRVARLFGSM